MRSKPFKDYLSTSLAESVVSPEMMGIILICLYIVHWFIHPEALEYLGQTLKDGAGLFEQGFSRFSNFELFTCLTGEKRMAYAAVETSIGVLQSVLVCAFLVALCIYIHKRTQNSFYMLVSRLPIIALLISIVQSGLFATLILTFPARAETQVLIVVSLHILTLTGYAVAALLIISGIVRDMPDVFRRR